VTAVLPPRPVAELSLAELEAEARHLMALEDAHGRANPTERWPTPGALAVDLNPRGVRQTPALRAIDAALVELMNIPDGRLIISMPPQEGKSQRAARAFVLWALRRNPGLRVAIASYEANLARRWGRAVRDDITANPRLGLAVRPDLSAQHEWQLDGHEGGVFTTGVGGALTGRPVDLLVIDDPVKGRAEADSEAFREAAWAWWTDTASTRLAPGAPVVLIMTRWHEDDLAGRLLAQDAAGVGEGWTVLNIPAEADHRPERGEVDPLGRAPGEFLTSARGRTRAQWEAIKRRSATTWTALYQGRPAPPEGLLFKRGQWARYDAPLAVPRADGSMWVPPAPGDQLAQSWDMAFKSTTGSDYVVGGVWLKRGQDLYLLDMVRRRMTFTETLDAVRSLSARWPQAIPKLVEDKANGPAVIDLLRKDVPGLIPVEPEGGKLARANAAAPLVVAGNVHLPAPELLPNVTELIDEAAAFPNGAHDDAVDMLTQAVLALVITPLIGEAVIGSSTGLRIGGAGGGVRLGGRAR
jgi:predicted phage terminase large subunit-like protein